MRFLTPLALILALALAVGGAEAATIRVTTTADEFGEPGGAGCALREAVEAANSNAKFGGCRRKGRGRADTVSLRGGKEYELTLPGDDQSNVQGDLDVEGALAISPRGKGKATIGGGGLDRVIEIHPGARLTGSGLIIRGGLVESGQDPNGGGGIYSHGHLTLRRSRVVDNASYGGGGGIHGGAGTTDLRRVFISGNEINIGGYGAGLAAGGGRLVVRESTLSGNTATDSGGGLWLGDLRSAAITASTISGNQALGEATGGGGVLVSSGIGDGEVRMSNVTISGNSSNTRGGGIFLFSGVLRLNAATITGNTADADADGAGTVGGQGGGLHGEITYRNSIVFGNSATTAQSDDCANTTSLGGSLHGIDTGCFGLTETSDARLGPLAANGGPTQTHALRRGSPAIGKAGEDAPRRDQRGRKRDRNPDAGAFERGARPRVS